jgi:transcriptional regulator, AbrB family
MDIEVLRVTSKGQITIPKAVRERLNLSEGDKVTFIEKDRNKRARFCHKIVEKIECCNIG